MKDLYRRKSAQTPREYARTGQPPHPGLSIPPNTGVGSKSRYLSGGLSGDFNIDTCELNDEYVSTSKVPGKRGKVLGKGTTATVTIMASRSSQSRDTPTKYVAVKEFHKGGLNEVKEDFIKKLKSEFCIASSLHHPNVVQSFRLCTHRGRFNHVMEYCRYGELFTLVQKKYLSTADNLCFFKQTVRGVAYLHSQGIAHRDVKLENLLLSEDGHLKISDFGVAEVFRGIHPGLHEAHIASGHPMEEIRLCSPGICGSLPYISPEVLAKDKEYDPRGLDVWSCAIVMITLACHGSPWPMPRETSVNYASFKNGWDKFLQDQPDGVMTETSYPHCGDLFHALAQIYSSGVKRLLLSMMCPDPARRASVDEVMANPYFRAIECCVPDDSTPACTSSDTPLEDSHLQRPNVPDLRKIHNHAPPERKHGLQHRLVV